MYEINKELNDKDLTAPHCDLTGTKIIIVREIFPT